MRTCALFLTLAAFTGGCYDQDIEPTAYRLDDGDPDDNSPAPTAADGSCELDLSSKVVDVRCDDFAVGTDQLPDGGNPAQELSWYCYGGGHEGQWQGEGCFTALPYYDDHGRFVGMGQKLPEDGIFRMSCGRTNKVNEGAEAPDDADWCDHWKGVDTAEEDKWFLDFVECGIEKTNFCVKRIDGVSYPAKDECWSHYVPPPSCP